MQCFLGPGFQARGGVPVFFLTVNFPLSCSSANASLRCDWHQSLSNSFLPALCNIQSNSSSSQNWIVMVAAVVLAHKVHHSVRDYFKAVRVAALNSIGEIPRLNHLKNFRKWDLLKETQSVQNFFKKCIPQLYIQKFVMTEKCTQSSSQSVCS